MNNSIPNTRMRTAIVLAAGSVPAALKPFVGRTCAAMLPVNGRPIIHWSVQYLREIGIERLIVGLRDTETRLPRFLKQTFGSVLDLNFVPVSEDLGPGFTLLQCLKSLPDGEPCLLVLGDTLFQLPDQCLHPKESFVLTAPVQEAARWCLVDVNAQGMATELADKPEKNPGDWPALVGVYYFRDVARARESLEKAQAAGVRSLQIRHALEPYIRAVSLRAYPAASWFDCGNPDLLTSSRRRLLQARSFNSVQIDELRGTITKRSEHRTKFISEINYYRQLPNDLVTFFPRLVDYSVAPANTFLTLEYYGYPTLSEVWVFEEFETRQWEQIFQVLARIIECFGTYTVELSSSSTFNFYWAKTLDRLEAFTRQSDAFARLIDAPEIRLNQRPLQGWNAVRTEVERRVRQIAERTEGQVIHGDLCFPNILFDPLSRLFKFIDPRGSFGDSGIFGDARYDVAKLMHSIDGGYDFLIHDMFSVNYTGVEMELQQFVPENWEGVVRAFRGVFAAKYNLGDVRLLEGLLFLSMCALHGDHPRRQAAMFVTGLRILNEVLRDENLH